jgi:tetratricopeptide (TPR) repeat protein
MKYIRLLSITVALLVGAVVNTAAQTVQEVSDAYNKASELLSSGNLDGVIAELEKCVTLAKQVGTDEAKGIAVNAEKNLPGFYLQKASKLVEAKKYAEALTAFEATVAAAEKYNNSEVKADAEKPIPQIYYALGAAAFQAKKYAEAITASDEAIARDPNYARAYFIKGASYQSLQDEAKMAESYQLAIEKGEAGGDPATAKNAKSQLSRFYYNEGINAMKQKKYDPATASFTKAVAADDTFADAYYRMSSCYNSLKNWDNAIANGEKALALRSGGDAKATDGIYYELGLAYQGKKDNGKACECFKKVTSEPFLAGAKYQVEVALKCK